MHMCARLSYPTTIVILRLYLNKAMNSLIYKWNTMLLIAQLKAWTQLKLWRQPNLMARNMAIKERDITGFPNEKCQF